MFDIKNLAVQDTADFIVCNAKGTPQIGADGKELSITFAGPGTAQYLQAKHNYDEKKNTAAAALFSGKTNKRDYKKDLEDRAEFFANITLSFNGFQYSDRAGFEGYKAFYRDPKLGFIVADADKFLADWGNFSPDSATTSPSA